MSELFYIESQSGRQGPFDLVSMMKKIRNGKLAPDDSVASTLTGTAIPARQYPELSSFFNNEARIAASSYPTISYFPLLSRSVRAGWAFASIHQEVFAFAGAMLCMIIFIGIGLNHLFGLPAAITGIIVSAWTFQSIYQVFILRANRGQYFSTQFFTNILFPSLLPVFAISTMMAGVAIIGLDAMWIPGLILCSIFTSMYSFVPLVIADRNLPILNALSVGRDLMFQQGNAVFAVVCTLMLINTVASLLLVPFAVVMPIITAAIVNIFDEIAAA